jgi:signal transduction histidine kinase
MVTRNVLLIEDEAVDAVLVRRNLRAQPGPAFGLEHVTSLEAGCERLTRGGVDAVLLDLGLPDSQGIDTVLQVRGQAPTLPIVVFTAADDEGTAIAALAAGAQDYLVKDDLEGSLLRRSLCYAIERSRIAQDHAHLDRRLHRVEKMESLGALCAGIGWGFNTLIGTIFDRCDHALASLDGARTDLDLRKDLLEINRAAFRAAEMIQRLRDYAAIERAASGRVDLARFAVEAADFLATIVSPEIGLTCEAGGKSPTVSITRPELHRILVSLVVNAAEAIGGGGGSIAISTGVLEADAALLAETHGWPDPKPGTYAFLRVADSGRGLASIGRDRIFDPFYTTKLAGRGLGLTGVVGILQRRRAVVRVDENRPVGTVFTILIPRAG